MKRIAGLMAALAIGIYVLKGDRVFDVIATAEKSQIGPGMFPILDGADVFAALPHSKALGKYIVVEWQGNSIVCRVKDVGPWNVTDAYWEKNTRPRAETDRYNFDSKKESSWNQGLNIGKQTNKAGADLSVGAWRLLGNNSHPDRIKGRIKWRFAKPGEVA